MRRLLSLPIFQFKSIQTKIVVLSTLISIGVLALMTFLHHRQTANIVYNNSFQENMVQTVSLIRNLQMKLDLVLEEVGQLATDRRIFSMDPNEQEQVFTDFLNFHSLYTNIFVFDDTFTITNITEVTGGDWKKNLLGKQFNKPSDFVFPYGTFAMKNKESVFTGSHWDIQGWGLMFAAVSPVFNPDEKPYRARGVISSGIFVKSDFLNKFIEGYTSHPNNFVLLVDRDGNIVAKSKSPVLSSQLKFRLSETAEKENIDSAMSETDIPLSNWTDHFMGREYIMTKSYFKTLNLDVFFAEDRQEIRMAINHVSREMAAIFILMSLGVILIAYFFGRSFLRPILVLVDSLNKVTDGDLSHQISEHREDEIGKANRAYNQMIFELQKSKMIDEAWRGETTVSSEVELDVSKPGPEP